MTLKMPRETLVFEWKWQALDMFTKPVAEISPELEKLESFRVYRPRLISLGFTMSTSTAPCIANQNCWISHQQPDTNCNSSRLPLLLLWKL
jgi:hypothetical protein